MSPNFKRPTDSFGKPVNDMGLDSLSSVPAMGNNMPLQGRKDDGRDSSSRLSPPVSSTASTEADRISPSPPQKRCLSRKIIYEELKEAVKDGQENGPVQAKKGRTKPQKWTSEEDALLTQGVAQLGSKDWKSIAQLIPYRNPTQCLQRWKKALLPGLKKGHWDKDEDSLLISLIREGKRNWGNVATGIPGRTSKQCRERWFNQLDPNIKRGQFSAEEDRIVLQAQKEHGNRWSRISILLPGRTEDMVKTRFRSLSRQMKVDKPAKQAPARPVQSTSTLKQQRIGRQQFQQHQQNQQRLVAQLLQQRMAEQQSTKNDAPVDADPGHYRAPNGTLDFPTLHAPNSVAAAFVAQVSQAPGQHPVAQFMYQQQQQHSQSKYPHASTLMSSAQAGRNNPSDARPPPAASSPRAVSRGHSRNSLNEFLSGLDDVGRISDLNLEDYGNMVRGGVPDNELWRLSGDLNRLSL